MEYLFLRRKKTRYTSVRQKTLLYRAASRPVSYTHLGHSRAYKYQRYSKYHYILRYEVQFPPSFEAYSCLLYTSTGYVDRDFAVKELYTLGAFLQAHPLWDAQIEQINVT